MTTKNVIYYTVIGILSIVCILRVHQHILLSKNLKKHLNNLRINSRRVFCFALFLNLFFFISMISDPLLTDIYDLQPSTMHNEHTYNDFSRTELILVMSVAILRLLPFSIYAYLCLKYIHFPKYVHFTMIKYKLEEGLDQASIMIFRS